MKIGKKNKMKPIKILSTLMTFIFITIMIPTKVFAQGEGPTISLNTTSTASSVTVTINYPSNATYEYYSDDGGSHWYYYDGPFPVDKNTTIKAQYSYYYGYYDSAISSLNITNIGTPASTTSKDGSWSSKNVQLKNTSEADLMVRVGDIDNFGYGFDSGFDPFSGNLTSVHGFPWTTPSDEPAGLDRIMVVSGYSYSSNFKTTGVNRDGYTQETSRSGGYNNSGIYVATNVVSAINMQYDLSGIDAETAIIQMFVDDLQPGNAKGITSGTVNYQVTINNVRVPELETIINNLDESGPKGRLITFTVPQTYIQLIRTGNISIKIDDPRSGITGDGYAVDFIKLLINPASLDNTGTINGKVTDKTTGASLSGVSVSSGNIKTTTDSSGNYTLLKVPAGQAVVTASKDGYATLSQPVDLVSKTTKTSNFQLVNTQKPGLPVISEDIMVPTNSSVNISINYPGKPAQMYYSVGSSPNGSSTWIPYTGTFSVDSNCTIKAKSVSASGVESDVASFDVVNIDKSVPSAPILTPSTTEPTNQDVIVTATYPSNAVSKKISIDGGKTWTDYTGPVTISANTTIVAKCANSVGTWSPEATLKITNIDKSKPDKPVISENPTTKTNKDVTVTITYPDVASTREISIDGGKTWNVYTGPVTISANTTIQARCSNILGTSSDIAELVITNIDKSKPATPTISENPTAKTNSDVTVTVSYPDGVAKKEISIDGGNTWTDYKSPVTISQNTTIEARCSNDLGTLSDVASLVITNIDKSVPEAPVITPSTTARTNKNVTVTILYSDDSTTKEYSLDNGKTWKNYTIPLVISDSPTTVMARSFNDLGTPSEVSKLDVNNIDKSKPGAPVITSNPDNNTPTNKDVTVTITYLSYPVTNEQYSINDGEWIDVNGNKVTFTVPANCNIKARCTNDLGTPSDVTSYKVTNIDKSKPATPVLTPDIPNSQPTNKDVTVTVTYPDSVVSKEISLDDGTTWSDYTGPIVVKDANKTTTIEARCTNAAGTISDIGTLVVSNIDRITPTATVTYVTNGDGTVTATLVNSNNPQKHITVTNNGGSASYTFTNSGTFIFEFVDDAGNTGAAEAKATVGKDPDSGRTER